MRSPCTATKSSPRSPQLEKACAQQWRTNAAKNKLINLKRYCLKKNTCWFTHRHLPMWVMNGLNHLVPNVFWSPANGAGGTYTLNERWTVTFQPRTHVTMELREGDQRGTKVSLNLWGSGEIMCFCFVVLFSFILKTKTKKLWGVQPAGWTTRTAEWHIPSCKRHCLCDSNIPHEDVEKDRVGVGCETSNWSTWKKTDQDNWASSDLEEMHSVEPSR